MDGNHVKRIAAVALGSVLALKLPSVLDFIWAHLIHPFQRLQLNRMYKKGEYSEISVVYNVS
jgi:hypothetical protein